MKLLLTSGGITNTQIENKLKSLLNKSFSDSNVVFIPTASQMEVGDKTWVINDLLKLKELGFKEIDITDPVSVKEEIWKNKLTNADLIFCEGGSNFHLARVFKESNLKDFLNTVLKDKVWLGISAGSMIMSPLQSCKVSQEIYEEDFQEKEDVESLGFIDFQIIPHLNSKYFTKVTEENIDNTFKDSAEVCYVLDDNCAVCIENDKVEVIGTGKWFKIN